MTRTPRKASAAILTTLALVVAPAAVAANPELATDCFGDPLPAGAVARVGTVRLRHPESVGKVLFSPDGKTLASASRSICLWDAASGQLLRTFGGQVRGQAVAFLPDGKSLAAAHDDKHVHLWDTATGQELRHFGPTPGVIQSLAASPDGKVLAADDGDGNVTLWDVVRGEKLRSLTTYTLTWGLAFSPDGKTLATVGRDDMLTLWDAAGGKQLHRLRGGLHTDPVAAAFSPDGKLLAEIRYGGSVRLWDVAKGTEVHKLTDKGSGNTVAFSPDGKSLAFIAPRSKCGLWDVKTGDPVREWAGEFGDHHGLVFSPDGRSAASWGGNPTIRLWDVAVGKPRAPSGHEGAVHQIIPSADGKTAITFGHDRTQRVFDLATGRELCRLDTPWLRDAVAVSRGGHWFGTARGHGTPTLWDEAGGMPADDDPLKLALDGVVVTSLDFSPDGKTMVTGEYNTGTVRFWDLSTCKELRKFQIPAKELRFVTYSTDGKTVALVGGRGKPTRLCDTATGKELRQLSPAERDPRGALFSPDGGMLLLLGDGPSRLFETATGKELPRLPGERGWESSAAFSPNGRTLALGGADRTIRLWELSVWKERAVITGHEAAVTALAFAADSRTLVSGSADATGLVWDLTGRARTGNLPARDLSEKEAEAMWADLAGDDAAAAYRAIRTLAASPKQTMALLRERLLPAPLPADPKVIARLLADLDGDEFQVRQKAAGELEALGEAARPGLLKALDGQPSAEVRSRVRGLLEKVEARRAAEVTRSRRALEVLEDLRTPEADAWLDRLAKGAADAPLTREALTVVERLQRRSR